VRSGIFVVAQRNILGDEICAVLENRGNNGENLWVLEQHPADHSLITSEGRVLENPRLCRIMTRHRRRSNENNVAEIISGDGVLG
jgi:hypothetical protein